MYLNNILLESSESSISLLPAPAEIPESELILQKINGMCGEIQQLWQQFRNKADKPAIETTPTRKYREYLSTSPLLQKTNTISQSMQ